MQDLHGSVQDCKLHFYLKVHGKPNHGYRSRMSMMIQIKAGIHFVIACIGAIWLACSYEHCCSVPDPRNQLPLRKTPNQTIRTMYHGYCVKEGRVFTMRVGSYYQGEGDLSSSWVLTLFVLLSLDQDCSLRKSGLGFRVITSTMVLDSSSDCSIRYLKQT